MDGREEGTANVTDCREFAYYYAGEGEQYVFYRVPKILFTDDRYRRISTDAKMLYGLMLDRMALSEKNEWRDEAGDREDMRGCNRYIRAAPEKRDGWDRYDGSRIRIPVFL